MENTRVLIHQDDEVIKNIDQNYESEKQIVFNRISAFTALYRELNIGELDTNSFRDILLNGLGSHIEPAQNKVRADLNAVGITSELAISRAIVPVMNVFTTLFNSLDYILNYKLEKSTNNGIKLSLEDVNISDGLVSLDSELDLTELKDTLARQYIDTEVGYDLVAKAEILVTTLNSINETLRSNGIYNVTSLNGFGDFADYVFPSQGSNAQIEINIKGIYQYANKIKSQVPA